MILVILRHFFQYDCSDEDKTLVVYTISWDICENLFEFPGLIFLSGPNKYFYIATM
jgi:hypothetical protein